MYIEIDWKIISAEKHQKNDIVMNMLVQFSAFDRT